RPLPFLLGNFKLTLLLYEQRSIPLDLQQSCGFFPLRTLLPLAIHPSTSPLPVELSRERSRGFRSSVDVPSASTKI
ncbi:LOW QUALITY PROTEIN: hypothetical protein PoB_005142500, partial [Plakobranchus ocellatus]